MDSEKKTDSPKTPQGAVGWAWMLLFLVGGLLILAGILHSRRDSSQIPIGGVIQTQQQMAAYNAAARTYQREMGMTGENGSVHVVSKELISTTSDFYFDSLTIKFRPGEKEKTIYLEPGRTSPMVILPGGPSVRLKETDSTEVWLANGVKYMDGPKELRDMQGQRKFRLTGRDSVVVALSYAV